MSVNNSDLDQSNLTGGNMEDLDFSEEDDGQLQQIQNTNMHIQYYGRNFHILALNDRDCPLVIQDMIKKVVSQTFQKITDNEMNLKIPQTAANYMISQVEKVILPSAGVFDDSQNDYLTNGLIEDIEPVLPTQDAWIRHRIQIDQKNAESYDAIGKLPDHHSNIKRKISPDQKSNYSFISTKSKASSKHGGKYNKPKMEKKVPLPIDLTEPVFVSEEEQKLREHKETERIKKEQTLEIESKKRKMEQLEEQMKLQKLQKEKNVIGTTYDYSGELLPVQKMKMHRFPPNAYNMSYEFKDPELPVDEKKRRFFRKGGVSKGKKKEQPLPPLQKGHVQPPIFDTIKLSEGVSLTFDGRRRVGPRPQTHDNQSLTLASLYPNQTMKNSQSRKIRLNKKEYDEIVSNQEKLGQHKMNEDSNLRMINTQDNPRDPHMFGKTVDSVFFASKLKSNTMSRTKSSGGIQINSVRMFETLNSQINEEDELVMNMIQKHEQNEKEVQLKKLQEKNSTKTPVDEFNYTLAYNKEWGKQHYETGQTLMNYPFGQHKPSQRDQIQSLGKTQKPRSRIGVKTPELSDQFSVRGATADGFRQSTTQDGLRSSQGIRIRVTKGNSNEMSNTPITK